MSYEHLESHPAVDLEISTDSESRQPPLTVDELIRNSDVSRFKKMLARYFIPKHPDKSVRLHELAGTPQIRKLVMDTAGKTRSSKSESRRGSNYHLKMNGNRLDALGRFAFKDSVFNEAVHGGGLAVLTGAVGTAEAFGGVSELVIGVNIGLIALNASIVAVQRYNRARTVSVMNKALARGEKFSPEYTNTFGIDRQTQETAVERHIPSGVPN